MKLATGPEQGGTSAAVFTGVGFRTWRTILAEPATSLAAAIAAKAPRGQAAAQPSAAVILRASALGAAVATVSQHAASTGGAAGAAAGVAMAETAMPRFAVSDATVPFAIAPPQIFGGLLRNLLSTEATLDGVSGLGATAVATGRMDYLGQTDLNKAQRRRENKRDAFPARMHLKLLFHLPLSWGSPREVRGRAHPPIWSCPSLEQLTSPWRPTGDGSTALHGNRFHRQNQLNPQPARFFGAPHT
jgi:hypothetical protein